MFVRQVSMQLKPDCVTKFAEIIATGVIPLLFGQSGFLDQITLVTPDCLNATVMTFWDNKESEEAFDRTRNPELLESLLEVIEGTPIVNHFEVISSSFYLPSAEGGSMRAM